MFQLLPTEFISASCGTSNAINLSIIGQGPIGYATDESPVNNLVAPLGTSETVLFTATEPSTLITHFLFTNVTGSTVNNVNLYLNGSKIVSNVTIKANTTVTLHSGGFTQYPQEVSSGGGGSSTWGSITGSITSQTDLFDTFQQKVVSFTAGETISSGMAVIIWTDDKVYKYDITNENHAGLTCGIAKTSATSGNPINVTLPGNIHVEIGSGWVVGARYFVSSSSILTTSIPTLGIIKQIGTGIDTDTVIIDNYNELIII